MDGIYKITHRFEVTGFCWLWKGKLQDGYGAQGWEGKTWAAHRLVYTLLMGEIPEGLDLDHLCKVRHCVNPDHLEPVTRGENIRRSKNIGKGDPWKHRRRTDVLMTPQKDGYCIRGHHLDTVGRVGKPHANGNTYYMCKQCKKDAAATYRASRGIPKRALKVVDNAPALV